jgi:transposase/predicted DNA-binding transcriptional regulator AlpA
MKTLQTAEADRERLERLARGRNTAQKVVRRARIVLRMMEGMQKARIAAEVSTSRPTVYRWITKYEKEGLEALLKDAPRSGRIPSMSKEKEKAIVDATLRTIPGNATHWSVREMAKMQGVSRMAVQRIWKKYNIKPHLVKRFKLSNDPRFVEKVQDIVGLYLNPPDKALVLSVDEKSQIQALDRTQPGLPLKKGRAGTMTHDYKRHGTTTLFAALNVLDGKVIGACMPRHRQGEFLKFLNKVEKETEREKQLHLIVDNYGSHKTKKVKEWLARHPRFHFHFTPTSASWLNMVERLFSDITTKKIRRGAFTSVKALEADIMDYIEKHNEDPKVYTWTKDADTILAKVAKCKDLLGTGH